MTEEEYYKALKRIEEIFHAKPGTAEGKELEDLVSKVELYEDMMYPIGESTLPRDVVYRCAVEKQAMICLEGTRAEYVYLLDYDGKEVLGVEWNDGVTNIEKTVFFDIARKNNGKVTLEQVTDNSW